MQNIYISNYKLYKLLQKYGDNKMPVYKSIQLVGTSDVSWADAVKNCYAEAKKSLRGIRNIQIIESDVKVNEIIKF